jgi:hypothetical protein
VAQARLDPLLGNMKLEACAASRLTARRYSRHHEGFPLAAPHWR